MTSSTPFPSGPITSVCGRTVVVRGDDIDTDRIIPARFMKCVTFDGLGEFLFHDVRKNADGSDKKKREPSAYNLWIKDKMAEIKADQPDLKGKDLMAAAIALWKKLDVKPVANSNKPTSNKKAKVNENEESKDESNEESDSKSDSEVETPKPKKGRKPAAPKKQAVEDDEDEMAIAQPKKGRKPAANKKGKKANNDSDNSDSDSA